MKSTLPDEMERQIKGWDRQLSRLARAVAKDLAAPQSADPRAPLDSPRTKKLRLDLCRNLARAVARLRPPHSLSTIADELASRLRLGPTELLLLWFEGERDLLADEARPQEPARGERSGGGRG